MEAALGALCRGGGWSYAAIWRSHPQDSRLLTLGEYYCQDEARKVGEEMLNQVHIVGEGIIGEAIVNGKCQWIFDDTCLGLNQISHADNQDLFQGYTWWQHQVLSGIKTIAIVPLQLQGVVQFGSMQKVFKDSVFFNQVKNMFDQMKSTSNDPSTVYTQTDALAYSEQSILSSMRSMNGILVHNKVTPLKSEKLENTEITESLRSSICFSSNSQRSLNDLTSYESGNISLSPCTVAMPVNSKSINEFKGFDNFSSFLYQNSGLRTPLQVKSSKEPDSSFSSVISAYKRLNNLQRTEVSSDQNMPEYSPCLYTSSNSPNSGIGFSSSCTTVSGKNKDCLQTESEKLLWKSIPLSSAPSLSEIQDNCFTPCHALMHEQSLVPNPGEGQSVLLHEESLFVQSDLLQVKDTNRFTSQAYCTDPESPNRTFEEATAGTKGYNMKGNNGNSDLLESMMSDLSANTLVQDWWDDNVLLAENLPNFGDTASESVTELANNHPLSIGARGLLSLSAVEQFLGANDNVGGDVRAAAAACSPSSAEASALAGCVSDYQLPSLAFQDCLTAYNAQLPPLVFPSSNYTSENVQNESSKATSVSLVNISVDDSCSFNTGNSKVSQPNNPEGMKIAKKRARPGESTRPRPKDRQQIQDRVKELREIVPNAAKCSIDALLDRTIKHMLFLQSVTKYAEKIKQSDEPKMIGKESGLVLKDKPSTGKDGGATWAYEVVGQTMVCPIIIEDLAPPGQMLIEMLCEERGFFLEIADNIRGFGLTILKGLMELRDSKIWARFLVEASRDVRRMDIFLSLVQLLQQNSLVRSTDQMAKVMNNGPPSFADYQRSSLPIPVGIAERLQ